MGERSGRGAWRWGPWVARWWLQAHHSNHRPIAYTSNRFRSAPTCHGQTVGRTDGIGLAKGTILSAAKQYRTLHWNWPLVHTAKHCYRQSTKEQATIGLRWSNFLVFFFKCKHRHLSCHWRFWLYSDVVASDASYLSSSSLLLLLLSAVSHNASVWAPTDWLTAARKCMHKLRCLISIYNYTFVVCRYAYCTFSLDDEFGGSFRIIPIGLLMCTYLLTSGPHQFTQSTLSFSTPRFQHPI